jgi:hypothetical protein
MGKPTDGALADTIKEALRLVDVQRAQGATKAECDAYLEKVVRESWPVTREWKYLCDKCGDTGLEMRECQGDATCGRSKRHLPHEYGDPCWCSAGARFRAKPKSDEDFSQATAKTKKPSRFGR